MAATVTPHTPVLKINGSALSVTWLDALSAARVDLALGLAGRAVLRFVDSGFALSSSKVVNLGDEVVVLAGETPLMTGEVTSMGLEQNSSQAPELVVTVDDRSCRLAVGTQNRAFLNLTHADLIRKLVTDAGLTLSASGTSAATHPYLLQTGSNLAFLNEVCARAGLVWWVEGAKQLKVAPAGSSSGTATVKLGEDLTAFSVRATTTGPESVEVRGWNPEQQQAFTGTHQTKIGQESNFVASAAGRKASARGSTAVALASPSPIDADEATLFAKAKFAEAASAAVVATGTGYVNGDLTLTAKVTVENAGPASGTYTISRIEHTYGRSGFTTRFTAGPVRPTGLVDVLGTTRPGAGLQVGGVFAAVVSDVKDPDDKGRIRVAWKVVDDQVESAWGRIVTLGAGKSRGMVFFPEVGDEVLIAFEHGDTRRPVILGGLFSSVNTLPTKDDIDQDKIKYRRITSRLGHVVELADGSAEADQHILLTLAGKKHKIRLGADQLDVVTDGTPISMTNGQAKVVLAKNGDITIDGNNIEIKAKAEIKVTATNKVTVKGTAGADLLGAQVKVKADGVASVEASGPLTIKGATVAIN
ncbi:phage baseplate assembly protein V [Nocardioides sp. C4-1]|uniref:phage baseplate assembly protein V n=1 Tax=Nocardioides sp. C4-1 TaxID=3151851 RepID=UPI0032631895